MYMYLVLANLRNNRYKLPKSEPRPKSPGSYKKDCRGRKRNNFEIFRLQMDYSIYLSRIE